MAYSFNPFTGTLDYYLPVPVASPLIPTTMTSNLSIPDKSQSLFRQHIIIGSNSIIIGINASLVGV